MPPETKSSSKPYKDLRLIALILGILGSVLIAMYIIEQFYAVTELVMNKKPSNTMSVEAQGKIPAIPDLAVVNLGVFTQGDTAEKAQSANTEKINQVIEFFKKQGIAKEDITTSNYNLYPTQDYKEGKTIITGYSISQNITVKIKNIDKENQELIGKIISGATTSGVNQINGISYSFDDPDNLRQQAREQAIVKAKEKASELAKASGLKLGKVINVFESGGYNPTPMYSAEGMGGMVGMGGDMKSASPDIQPGQQDITASMTVTFEVK